MNDDIGFDSVLDLNDPLLDEEDEDGISIGEVDPDTATLDEMVSNVLENVPHTNDFMEEEEEENQTGQKISNDEVIKKIPLLEKMVEFLEPKYFIFLETTDDAFANIQEYSVGKLLTTIQPDFYDFLVHQCVLNDFEVPQRDSDDEEEEEAQQQPPPTTLSSAQKSHIYCLSLKLLWFCSNTIYSDLITSMAPELYERFLKWSQLQSTTTSEELNIELRGLATCALTLVMSYHPDTLSSMISSDLISSILKRISNYLELLIENKKQPSKNWLINNLQSIQKVELQSLLRALGLMAGYQDFLAPFLEHKGIEVVNTYLTVMYSNKSASNEYYALDKIDRWLVSDLIECIDRCLTHAKFQSLFVEKNGLSRLLQCPKSPFLAANLSQIIFSLSMSNASRCMEQVSSQLRLVERLVEWIGFILQQQPHAQPKQKTCQGLHRMLAYRSILQQFDKMNGLEKLLNCLRSPISFPKEESSPQLALHVCLALLSYFRAQFCVIACVQMNKQQQKDQNAAFDILRLKENTSLLSLVPSHLLTQKKKVETDLNQSFAAIHHTSDSSIIPYLGNIVSYLNRNKWKAVTNFIDFDGYHLLLEVIYFSTLSLLQDFFDTLKQEEAENQWKDTSIALHCLEILFWITLAPFSHSALCEAPVPQNQNGLSFIVRLIQIISSEQHLNDSNARIVITALQVIGNIVTYHALPYTFIPNNSRQIEFPSHLIKIWQMIRNVDGIRVLIDTCIKSHSTAPNFSQRIRAAAAYALLGLSRDTFINQILTQFHVSLPLSDYLKRPKFFENLEEEHAYLQFKELALQLIALTSGKEAHTVSMEARDHTMVRLEKAAIAANTQITYRQPEMLQLIHQYLNSCGLHSTAKQLQSEAKLQTTNYPQSTDSQSTRLSKIVVSYLRQQHKECEEPYTMCPPFSLWNKHSCPKPSHVKHASKNLFTRLTTNQLVGRNKRQAGFFAEKYQRRYIYNRFKLMKHVRREGMELPSCVQIHPLGNQIAVGTEYGDLMFFDEFGNFKETYALGEYMRGIRYSPNNGSFLMTWNGQMDPSFSTGDEELKNQTAKLWKTSNQNFTTPLLELKQVRYALFNHQSSQIIATGNSQVQVWDIETLSTIATLQDVKSGIPPVANEFNMANFHPQDDLILSDAVLWDFRIPHRMIHRFDKLNRVNCTSYFHPNANEVLIDSAVWDLRNFKLLYTCDAIRQNKSLHFSHEYGGHQGNTIFATFRSLHELEDGEEDETLYKCFRTVDSLNYETIGTFNMEKALVDLALDPLDRFVATVVEEAQGICGVRLYDIGRRKFMFEDVDELDESEEEDEDEEDDEDDMDEFADDFLLDDTLLGGEGGDIDDDDLLYFEDEEGEDDDDDAEDDEDMEDSDSEEDEVVDDTSVQDILRAIGANTARRNRPTPTRRRLGVVIEEEANNNNTNNNNTNNTGNNNNTQ